MHRVLHPVDHQRGGAPGWTGDGMLRHAAYKRLREAADAASVFRR